MDPHKHWHLCGEHRHPSLLGQGARNRMFSWNGEPERGPGSWGDVGSAPAPLNALLRNSLSLLPALIPVPCCFPRAAFPLPTAPPWLPPLTGTQVTPRGTRAPRTQDLILQAERGSWHFLKWEKHLPLDTPIPPHKHREEEQKHRGSSADPQVFPMRGEARRGKSWLGFSSSCRVQGSDRTKAPSLLTPHCPYPAVFCPGILSLPFPAVSAPDLSASASPGAQCLQGPRHLHRCGETLLPGGNN